MPNERLYLFIIFCPDHDYRVERIVQERDFDQMDSMLTSDPSIPEFRWYEIVRGGAHSEEGIARERGEIVDECRINFDMQDDMDDPHREPPVERSLWCKKHNHIQHTQRELLDQLRKQLEDGIADSWKTEKRLTQMHLDGAR